MEKHQQDGFRVQEDGKSHVASPHHIDIAGACTARTRLQTAIQAGRDAIGRQLS